LSRRDANQTLEVMGELALVREAGVRGHLRQGKARSCLQEVLGALDATGEDVLVRRQPGGRLELPRSGTRCGGRLRPAARVGLASRCPSMYSTTTRGLPGGPRPGSGARQGQIPQV